MIYEDATDSADERVDFPEYVQGFLALGFTRVGRLIARLEDVSHEELAARYDVFRRGTLEHLTVPTPILTPPGENAFVEVSWYFGSPSVRIRSHLDDGFLVDTLRRWDSPPWDRPGADIDKLMMKNHAPHLDRSTRVVATSDCGELWREHLDHLGQITSSRTAVPIEHVDLAGYITVATATVERDSRYSFDSAERLPVGENVPVTEVAKAATAAMTDAAIGLAVLVVLLAAATLLFLA